MNQLRGRRVQRWGFSLGRAFGPIDRPACQGRCCADRTAPVFVTFGLRHIWLYCARCRARQHELIRDWSPKHRGVT